LDRIGMRDVLGIAVAIVIALLSQIVQPWTPLWWTGMVIAGVIAAYAGGHLFWGQLPLIVTSQITNTVWSPTGKLRPWVGLALLMAILGGGYVAISRATAPSPEIPLPKPRPQEASRPEGVTITPPLQILSRGDKMIFVCDVPPPNEKEAAEFPRKIEEAKRNLEILGDAIGATYTITYIRGGIRLDIEATSDEIKHKILMATGMRDLTKLTYEERRVGNKILVTIYANFPEPIRQFYSLLTPDPSSKDTLSIKSQIERVFSFQSGVCQLI
jgi:hypothetical protein